MEGTICIKDTAIIVTAATDHFTITDGISCTTTTTTVLQSRTFTDKSTNWLRSKYHKNRKPTRERKLKRARNDLEAKNSNSST